MTEALAVGGSATTFATEPDSSNQSFTALRKRRSPGILSTTDVPPRRWTGWDGCCDCESGNRALNRSEGMVCEVKLRGPEILLDHVDYEPLTLV